MGLISDFAETVGEIKDIYPVSPLVRWPHIRHAPTWQISRAVSQSHTMHHTDSGVQGTQVTIVHSDSQLLNNTYPDKFRRAVEQRVRRRGANIVFGDYVDTIPEPGAAVDIITRGGKTLASVDLVVRPRSMAFLLQLLNLDFSGASVWREAKHRIYKHLGLWCPHAVRHRAGAADARSAESSRHFRCRRHHRMEGAEAGGQGGLPCQCRRDEPGQLLGPQASHEELQGHARDDRPPCWQGA